MAFAGLACGDVGALLATCWAWGGGVVHRRLSLLINLYRTVVGVVLGSSSPPVKDGLAQLFQDVEKASSF